MLYDKLNGSLQCRFFSLASIKWKYSEVNVKNVQCWNGCSMCIMRAFQHERSLAAVHIHCVCHLLSFHSQQKAFDWSLFLQPHEASRRKPCCCLSYFACPGGPHCECFLPTPSRERESFCTTSSQLDGLCSLGF